jgi:hypothetical protein
VSGLDQGQRAPRQGPRPPAVDEGTTDQELVVHHLTEGDETGVPLAWVLRPLQLRCAGNPGAAGHGARPPQD